MRHGRAAVAIFVALATAAVLHGQGDPLEVLQVRPSFFVIAGAGGNVGVQAGEDGLVVVDTGTTMDAARVLAAIKRISPKPIRYVINTGPDADHAGGNEVISSAGEKLFGGGLPGGGQPVALSSADRVVPIVAVEGVLRHLSKSPAALWPTEVFHYARKAMYLNGEAIEMLHQPAAHTDSDLFAFFRKSDVVMAGDVLDTRQFPVIDVARGGSIQGELAALNRLADLAVPSTPVVTREAGTIVVPGHGRLCDSYDVVDYRDMLVIVRDRISSLMKAGKSLGDVKAAQPAKGYVGRYGNPDRFIEAVYQSLSRAALSGPRGATR